MRKHFTVFTAAHRTYSFCSTGRFTAFTSFRFFMLNVVCASLTMITVTIAYPFTIIVTECWFPLGHGDKNLLSDPTIGKIAQKHGKTIAQIIIRWHIDEGFSVIPGATNPDYIKENISIFDFKLDAEDMATMRSLDQEKRFYNMSIEQLENFVLNRAIDR